MTLVGDGAAGAGGQLLRQVIAVNGAEKERRPDPLVEVLAGAAKGVERGGRPQEVVGAGARQKPSNERLRTAGSRVMMMVTRSSAMCPLAMGAAPAAWRVSPLGRCRLRPGPTGP